VIRAFVAVRIEPDMVQKIFEVQAQLKRKLSGIRWVRAENLHFTLKFLGEFQEEKIAPILKALEQSLSATPAFPMNGRGIGVFPDIKRARVLWIGLWAEGLESLAKEVEKVLEAMGFAREKRAFTPHLTIGRWGHFSGSIEHLKEEIERWRDHDFGESWVKEVVFFQSVLKPQGAVYKPLGVLSLGAERSLP